MNLPMGLLLACTFAITSATANADPKPIKPVEHVDLDRFMGDWYVIATIPTWFEKEAYDAVETYALQADGHVATSFRFRSGSFDGRVKTIHSTGFIEENSGNAVWGVQVFWPIKAQYIVAYLKEDYSQTIVARTPPIPPADYESLLGRVQAMGYPSSKIRKVPQAWPETGP